MLDLFEHAVGITIVVVRLTASADAIERRLNRRYHDDDRELGWHLARAPELDAILDRSPVRMKTVDASASPNVVAQAVLDAVSWVSEPRSP
jgi:hypothetical protein